MTSTMLPLILAVLAVLWTLLPVLRCDKWWVRGFEFPRVQIAILSSFIWAAYALSVGFSSGWDLVLLAVLAICTLYQLARIFRYTVFARLQVPHAQKCSGEHLLSAMVANVLMTNRNAEGLLSIINNVDPDVILLVETDSWWETQVASLESTHGHSVKHPLDNLYGMHLYSKLPLVDAKVEYLVEEDKPSIHAGVVLRSGQHVELHAVHPAPPSPSENQSSAERDAELLVVAKSINAEDQPTIVMGDLNDVAWSDTTRLFQKISRLLDPRIGRGMFNTFHAHIPFLRWPLDHVFCSPDFALVSMERLPSFGSDHFPIHVVLCHTPGDAVSDGSLDASADDESLAQDKIDKVDADEAAL